MKTALLIGQAPSRTMEQGAIPILSSNTGSRLALRMKTSLHTVAELFDTTNLIDEYPGPAYPGSKYDAFPDEAARQGALIVNAALADPDCQYLVAAALGEHTTRKLRFPWLRWVMRDGVWIIGLPHPGGTSRWWNNPTQLSLGEELYEELLARARREAEIGSERN